MNLEPQFMVDEAYEVYPGCPTLTFVADNKEQALPYHSFKYGIFEKDLIRLKFETGALLIRGHHLGDLWKHLQLQDVRMIRCNDAPDDDLQVATIVWERKEAQQDTS